MIAVSRKDNTAVPMRWHVLKARQHVEISILKYYYVKINDTIYNEYSDDMIAAFKKQRIWDKLRG